MSNTPIHDTNAMQTVAGGYIVLSARGIKTTHAPVTSADEASAIRTVDPSRAVPIAAPTSLLIRRHNGAIVTSMAVSVLEKRPRQSLRLDPMLWEEIDRERGKRPGSISRNTWITEAILEKLSRAQANQKPKRVANA